MSDVDLAREVVEQALCNLEDHAAIVSLAVDRGVMDGKLLWRLETKHITFHIPAKTNMDVLCGRHLVD